jgi:hypothetical protein
VQSKKALIRRMAAVAAGILVLGLAGVLLTLGLAEAEHREQAAEARRERARIVEGARADIEELAQRITTAPVDPIVVGEIQAAYFAELPQGRRLVWAVGPEGEFLFGVPREAFARLNRVWDTHQQPLLDEGLFVDRTDFLRRLIRAEAGEITHWLREGEVPRDLALHARSDRDDWLTLSTPLRSVDGGALGNLYLEVETPRPAGGAFYHEGVVGGFGATSAAAFGFLWFLLPTWVYVDARERGVRRATLWSFLVLWSLFLGLVVYLIARPEQPARLDCPGCGREVDGGAFCPHCGQDLARAFCSACRYPLKPDWVFCPSCRTEVVRAATDDAAGVGGGDASPEGA